MEKVTYDKEITALLVIDPYNDFISEGGKIWDRLRGVAEANNCVPHMLQVLNAARKAKLRVFYALHRRYRPGDYETLEVHCANSEGSVVAKDLRIRELGRRDPQRIRTATGRHRDP
jgi:nicotinamidase-related amidase